MKNNNVILLLGSNIEPDKNIRQALDLINQHVNLVARSHLWETEAVGSNGPNFLNIAVVISTPFEAARIKENIIQPIEDQLGRMRTKDKYAPRTMDIDIILFNDQVVDQNLWSKAFIALPVAELVPDLPHPTRNQTLSDISMELKNSAFAELYKNQ